MRAALRWPLALFSVRFHEAHYIVRLFHAADMELDTIQLSWPCIDYTELTIYKVCLDVTALHKFWPVAALFGECQGKQYLLPQLDCSFQDAEPTVKDTKLGSVPQWFRQLQEYTNSFTQVRKFFWWLLTWHVLAFDDLNPVKHPLQTTGNSMFLVSKEPWLSWDAHESGACALLQPFGHWLG